MGKKIIILNGSPRKAGNTTALTAEFVRGAEESGSAVTEFFLHGMNISGCKGCFGGGKDPQSPCAQKDDMDKIYYKSISGHEWGDVHQYELTVDSSIGPEKTAELICDYISR